MKVHLCQAIPIGRRGGGEKRGGEGAGAQRSSFISTPSEPRCTSSTLRLQPMLLSPRPHNQTILRGYSTHPQQEPARHLLLDWAGEGLRSDQCRSLRWCHSISTAFPLPSSPPLRCRSERSTRASELSPSLAIAAPQKASGLQALSAHPLKPRMH